MSEGSEQVLQRYQSDQAARRYAGVHRGRRRHKREEACLRRALRGLRPGSRVLDLPCGTGRMFSVLSDLRLDVVAADGSAAMVRAARREAERHPGIRVVHQEDAFKTGFPDRSFDAVVCNRLLHHFREPQDRLAVLRELTRISRNRVVVSFFCTHSLEAQRTRLSRALGKKASERGAIPYTDFHREVESAGLHVQDVVPTLAPISQQWYVVGRRRDAAPLAGPR
ncbi:MAG: class I SAM-dependent methyltransferase [Myxococcota bacterium]